MSEESKGITVKIFGCEIPVEAWRKYLEQIRAGHIRHVSKDKAPGSLRRQGPPKKPG